MAVTLDQIEEFMKKKGMNYDRDDERDLINFGMSDEANSALIYIRAKDDGKYFQLQMEPLKKDKSGSLDIDSDHTNIVKVLMQLLYNNYRIKYGNWEYDFNDGDLRFAVEIPVEDSMMTYEQFERVISVCFTALGDIEGIQYILDNGDFPKEKSEDELMAAHLRKMLAEIEGKKSDSDDSDGI